MTFMNSSLNEGERLPANEAIETATAVASDLSTNAALETTKAPKSCLAIHSARRDWVEISLTCSVEAADQLHEFLAWFFAELEEEVRESLRTAFRELLMNAIEWGGKLNANERVRIAILLGRRAVMCRIADPGNGFRMENLRHAAICNPEGAPFEHMSFRQQLGLRAGGFGLTIIRDSVDELLYNDAGNEVVFLKYTSPPR